MDPLSFFKCLADETRLKSILLIHQEQELCVCELMQALDEIQPKISRHLAQLRKAGILQDRKQSQWVFYSINTKLPQWALSVIQQASLNDSDFLAQPIKELEAMGDRPERAQACC